MYTRIIRIIRIITMKVSELIGVSQQFDGDMKVIVNGKEATIDIVRVREIAPGEYIETTTGQLALRIK